ncbi:hypothetical protein [Streptomyces sp. ME18-1-4]|uniref:hypothetical protein n=1 Tax=Streptomyces sp. ME18-1-4 TaxID=3028685 RepID=UPI0029ADFEE5|nr:hypothetical protein [Streptomyces sp. ME18-1-4]MDX3244780.1 hypothetical protein [Streptomyces sp. ME18-1-4]
MSNRLKRTLASVARGAAIIFGLVVYWTSRDASPAGVVRWAIGFAAIFAGITWYTWWFYGESPKALALQAKAEEKKTQRLGR